MSLSAVFLHLWPFSLVDSYSTLKTQIKCSFHCEVFPNTPGFPPLNSLSTLIFDFAFIEHLNFNLQLCLILSRKSFWLDLKNSALKQIKDRFSYRLKKTSPWLVWLPEVIGNPASFFCLSLPLCLAWLYDQNGWNATHPSHMLGWKQKKVGDIVKCSLPAEWKQSYQKLHKTFLLNPHCPEFHPKGTPGCKDVGQLV